MNFNYIDLYLFKVNKSKLIKYGVDSILQKYLNPMRRLTEELPHHNVEVQLEIVGSIPQIPPVQPQRRYGNYFRHPPRRSNDDITTASPMLVSATPETTKPSPTTQPTTTTTTTDPGQRPVNMDDLKKALEDFEKKFSTDAPSSASANFHYPSIAFPQRPNPSLVFPQMPNPLAAASKGLQYPVDRSLQGLIKVLRSGVQLDNPVPKPTNENLEWFQVKIPK